MKKVFYNDYSITYFTNNFETKDDIKWIKFVNFTNEKDEINVPLFLINVYENEIILDKNKKYHMTSKYVSNNGVAIGATRNEAILHGLNEILERNSVSHHLIDVFLNNYIYDVIDSNTLPQYLKDIYDEIEITVDEKVNILELNNEYGLNVYMVYTKNKSCDIPFKGFGASLSSEYALERALLECLQSFHLYNNDCIQEDKLILNRFEKYPVYSKIIKLDYSNIAFNIKKFEIKNYNGLNVKDMLNKITTSIRNNGLEIYFHEIINDNNVCCVHTIIPNLEKFHLVLLGNLVIPRKENIFFNDCIQI